MTMTEATTLKPTDFIDRKFCDWFRISHATKGPRVLYACKTCSHISGTKECPAFRVGESSDGGKDG